VASADSASNVVLMMAQLKGSCSNDPALELKQCQELRGYDRRCVKRPNMCVRAYFDPERAIATSTPLVIRSTQRPQERTPADHGVPVEHHVSSRLVETTVHAPWHRSKQGPARNMRNSTACSPLRILRVFCYDRRCLDTKWLVL